MNELLQFQFLRFLIQVILDFSTLTPESSKHKSMLFMYEYAIVVLLIRKLFFILAASDFMRCSFLMSVTMLSIEICSLMMHLQSLCFSIIFMSVVDRNVPKP